MPTPSNADGAGTAAHFDNPSTLTVDSDGNRGFGDGVSAFVEKIA